MNGPNWTGGGHDDGCLAPWYVRPREDGRGGGGRGGGRGGGDED